jgi:hypothetical protein
VGSTAERLVKVKSDFLDFDVEKLIAGASDCVAWLKTTDGKMQHFFTDNKTAYCCYLAGHSVYFNPPEKLQKLYLKELTDELGINFGREKDGGFGGDIEVFACRGRHVTDWHFDGQENFTIQLRGTKRWSIVPSGISCPITNQTNPNSAARDKYLTQRKCHSSYAPTGSEGSVPTNFSSAQTFVLRPGSVMYFPAGMWHHVTADSDEGSLSINFSLTTTTWLDLLMNALTQQLWKNPDWRKNVIVKDPSSARKHLAGLLRELPGEVAKLVPRDLLPDGLFLENREKLVDVAKSEQGGHVDITRHTLLVRNPLATVIPENDPLPRPHGDSTWLDADKAWLEAEEPWLLDVGFGNKDFRSNLQVKLIVKNRLACVLYWLEGSNPTPADMPYKNDGRDRWASFTAGDLYQQSHYRTLVRRHKEQHKAADLTNASCKPTCLKGKEIRGEDPLGGDLQEDMQWDEHDEENQGRLGFGDVEELLSVLVFNGYLRVIRTNHDDKNTSSIEG